MTAVHEADRLSRYLHLLRCPGCEGGLLPEAGGLRCKECSCRFEVTRQGLPALYRQPKKAGGVTGRIRRFYEENPFPNYEGFEDLASLLEKARQGVFARLLDEQIPFGSRILECGCGTGQLTNFLGIAHRTLFGTDLSLPSLELAEQFRSRHSLERVFFLQMNLFEPVFPPNSFDFVICNGVLHHTPDPCGGLLRLADLVRPGGYLIVGLYHRYGRLTTDLRRILFRLFGRRAEFLDPRKRELGAGRWSAWYQDQYCNPHESKHTVGEVLKWLENSKLEFTKSLPKTRFLSRFSKEEQLFEPEPPGLGLERWLKEASLTVRGGAEGGFFTIIARKVS